MAIVIIFHNFTVFTAFLIKYMQPWWAEETFVKNIKNLTDLKRLYGSETLSVSPHYIPEFPAPCLSLRFIMIWQQHDIAYCFLGFSSKHLIKAPWKHTKNEILTGFFLFLPLFSFFRCSHDAAAKKTSYEQVRFSWNYFSCVWPAYDYEISMSLSAFPISVYMTFQFGHLYHKTDL